MEAAYSETILCKDYSAAAKVVEVATDKIPDKTSRYLIEVAHRKAVELGYEPAHLNTKLVSKDKLYIAYLYPKSETALGGDLFVIMAADGRVFCFHRGA